MHMARLSLFRLTLLASAIVLFAVVRASAQTAPLLKLHVATIPSDIGAEVYYAKDMGFFSKAGLDVDITPITNGAAISSAVMSGAVDIGYATGTNVALAHEKGFPFTIVAPANLHVGSAPTSGLLAVTRDSTLESGKDLTGKTVAVTGLSGIAYFAARAWIDKTGGDSKSVKYVELPLSEMTAAVKDGRVATATMDVLGDPLIGKPEDTLRLLANSFNAVAPNFLPSMWVATTPWVSAHPAEAKAFIGAIHAAAVWANAHHRESAAILINYTKIPLETLQTATRVTYATSMSAESIQPNIDVAAKYGFLQATFPARELISPLALR
jgi:NitT/TauT family transport system substrate-binding protein